MGTPHSASRMINNRSNCTLEVFSWCTCPTDKPTKPCYLTANLARSQCEWFLHKVTIDMWECICHHCTALLAAAVLSKSFLHAAMADGSRGESNGIYTPPCFILTRMLAYSDYLGKVLQLWHHGCLDSHDISGIKTQDGQMMKFFTLCALHCLQQLISQARLDSKGQTRPQQKVTLQAGNLEPGPPSPASLKSS